MHVQLMKRGFRTILLCFVGIVWFGCGANGNLKDYRIAVSVEQDDNADLFVLDGNGKVVERVTSTPHRSEMWPAWDPSGKILFFEAKNPSARSVALCRKVLGESVEDTLYIRTKPGDLWFSLAPNGKTIAYVTRDSSGPLLIVRNLENDAERVLNDRGQILIRPEWASDSRRLVCQARSDSVTQWDLMLVDSISLEKRRLVSSSADTEFKARWAPDGKLIVFSVAQGDVRRRVELNIVDVEKETTTVLAAGDQQRVVSGVWSSKLSLAALKERPLPLTVLTWINPFDPESVVHTELAKKWRRGRIVWSHDGRYVAANVTSRRRGKSGGWSIIIIDSSGKIVKLWDESVHVFCPAWAPTLGS